MVQVEIGDDPLLVLADSLQLCREWDLNISEDPLTASWKGESNPYKS